MEYLLSFGTTLLLSTVLTKTIISARASWQWLVQDPRADRWHKIPTPTLGGVAIFISFLFAFFAFDLHARPENVKILAGGSLIFLLGLWDDVHPLPAYAKLVGQIISDSVSSDKGIFTYTNAPAE